jgi:putative restriction endonuclease
LHKLYDRGYVTVTPDYEFIVGQRLRDEFSNGRSYYSMSGSKIRLPVDAAMQPDRDRLDWHRQEVFKG